MQKMWVMLSPAGEGIGAEATSQNSDAHPSGARSRALWELLPSLALVGQEAPRWGKLSDWARASLAGICLGDPSRGRSTGPRGSETAPDRGGESPAQCRIRSRCVHAGLCPPGHGIQASGPVFHDLDRLRRTTSDTSSHRTLPIERASSARREGVERSPVHAWCRVHSHYRGSKTARFGRWRSLRKV
jgi:hypothetical protein